MSLDNVVTAIGYSLNTGKLSAVEYAHTVALLVESDRHGEVSTCPFWPSNRIQLRRPSRVNMEQSHGV